MNVYEYKGWTVVETGEGHQTITHKTRGTQHERVLYKNSKQVKLNQWLRLIEHADQSLQPLPQDYMRRAVRVLAMIGELHKLGFQRLRFHTQDRGIGLRLYVTTTDKIRQDHGAIMITDQGSVLYVSGMGNKYFDWTDATADNARQLAAKFMIRFPELVEQGRGLDLSYAGWYQYMLGLAERGYFPIIYDEYSSTDGPYINLINAPDSVKLIKPPGGEGKE